MATSYTHSNGNTGSTTNLLAGRKVLLNQFQETLLEQASGLFITSQIGRIGDLVDELGQQLAKNVSDHFEDGVYTINLQGHAPLSQTPVEANQAQRYILSQIISPVDVPQGSRALTRLYRDTFAKRNALLLLENAADAQQIRYLIPRKGSKVVITSAHDLSGSFPKLHPHFVSGLTPEAAYTLLTSISPRALLQNKRMLIKLCDLLDNSPLVIAVTAPLLEGSPRLSAREVINQYALAEQRVRALRGHTPTPLECALELAYDALPPQQQVRFAQLAVFPGVFTYDAARMVLGINQAEVNRTLRILTQRNLVNAVGDRELKLHWDIRQFAQSRLLGQPQMATTITQRYILYIFQQTLPEAHMHLNADEILDASTVTLISDHLSHTWLRSNNQEPGWAQVVVDPHVRLNTFLRLTNALQAILTQEIFTYWLDTAISLAESVDDANTVTQLQQLRQV